MNNFITHLRSQSWQSIAAPNGTDFFSRGQMYIGRDKISPEEMIKKLSISEAKHQHILKQLNGFYSFVKRDPLQIFAAVDRIRSMPLFYGQYKGVLYLSDDAEWVRQQVQDFEIDPIAKEEFQLTGYVTGSATLYSGVKQLQAGEYLKGSFEDCEWKLQRHRFYCFSHIEPEGYDLHQLQLDLHAVSTECIDRLIDYAQGRQIIIPLSGGYDSRLIATLLAFKKYPKVLTYTYGIHGNKESLYSQKVAEALDLQWHFEPYTEELWHQVEHSAEFCQYQTWASGLNSLSHIQDWLAVKMLKHKGIADSDCVFVPGHSGDFVAGSHIPEIVFSKKILTKTDLLHCIFTRHYRLAPIKLVSNKTKEFWMNRISNQTSIQDVATKEHFASAFESWVWQERQAKFICNSVKVYEFFDYDWWLPFWDLRFMNYWGAAPLELRKERAFYIDYVKNIYLEAVGYDEASAKLDNAADRLTQKSISRFPSFKGTIFFRTLVLLKNFFKRKGINNLAFGKQFPEKEYRTLLKDGYLFNGICAYFLLRKLEKK